MIVIQKLEQTVADNARLERELQQLRRALQARRAAAPAHPTAMLEDGNYANVMYFLYNVCTSENKLNTKSR